MAKLEVIFELGGVPTEAKYTNLTEQQWAILGYFASLKRQKISEEILDAVEYLAMLTSPHPKETMKVIDGRRTAIAKIKKDAGLTDEDVPNSDLIKKEAGATTYMRNTTFFDDVEKFVGKESADILRTESGVVGPSIQKYELDFEDVEYIAKIKRQQEEVAALMKSKQDLNSVVF